MRFAVIGAGAIGGFVAAALARSGADVAVVARGAHLDAIRRNGITLAQSELGPFSARVDASADLRELDAPDIVLLSFKAHQFDALLPQLEPAAARGAAFVTLQNGVPFWFRRTPPLQSVDPSGKIGAILPDAQLIGGVVHISGHIIEPGVLHQSSGMRLILGPVDPHAQRPLDALAAALAKAGLTAELPPNVAHFVWQKLVNNAGFNPLSATTGMTIHEMIRNERTLAELRALMGETVAVGERLGVIAPGDVDVEARFSGWLARPDVKTSMLQDIEAGRRLELDPIVGAPVELGEDLGVAVPHLRAIYDELRARTSATT
jgi:2-dehydropantoate 2-reductase